MSGTEYKGTVAELTNEIKNEILETVDELNASGVRVVAVAQKTNLSPEGVFSIKYESDMVLMGYIGFLDPYKETSAHAIKALNEHGAVDIAKESVDITLLKKDLMVLERGVIEGRKTFANIIKYVKMTASSNFRNVFSVLIACAFLPMLPVQILVLNLIYDISCISIPWDNVDADYLKKLRK